jgi:hypothetical protein
LTTKCLTSDISVGLIGKSPAFSRLEKCIVAGRVIRLVAILYRCHWGNCIDRAYWGGRYRIHRCNWYDWLYWTDWINRNHWAYGVYWTDWLHWTSRNWLYW